MAMIAIYY